MTIQAGVLGSFRLTIDGRSIEPGAFERPSGLRLLKLLLVTPGHRISREVAAEMLWPEAHPERSRVGLRKSIHFARRALEASGVARDVICGGSTMLALDRSSTIEVDVDRLRAAIDDVLAARPSGRTPAPASLQVMLDLGANDILPDEPYEEWLLPSRERLHRSSVEAILIAVTHARATGLDDLALGLVDQLLRLEPAEEEAHRLAIELHVGAGRLDAARRQLVACAAALADVYGVEPSPELRALLAEPPPHWRDSDTAARGIGAALVDALVETIAALSGKRPLALAFADGMGTLRERPRPNVAA